MRSNCFLLHSVIAKILPSMSSRGDYSSILIIVNHINLIVIFNVDVGGDDNDQ